MFSIKCTTPITLEKNWYMCENMERGESNAETLQIKYLNRALNTSVTVYGNRQPNIREAAQTNLIFKNFTTPRL